MDDDRQDDYSTPRRKHRPGLTRIAAACERCRRRKQKCDQKDPCGPCEAAGVKCVLSERLTVVSGSVQVDEEALRDEIRHLRAQVTDLNRQLVEERQNSITRMVGQSIDQQLSPPTSAHRSIIFNPTSPEARRDQGYYPNYTGRILRPTFGGAHQNRVDAGDKSSAWTLWKDDHSAETPTDHASADSISLYEDHGLALIDIFFDQRWPHLPILHKPTFLRDKFEPFARGQDIPGIARFQLYMVFAIAALEHGRIKGKKLYNHRDLFDVAVRDLTSVLLSDDLACITSLMLLLMYGRTEPQSVNMWHTTGLALRTAIGMDLHRAESIRHMELKEAEMSKRIFWSIYAYDRSIAIYLGRPLGIQDADINMPYPLQLTDNDLETQTLQTVVPRVRTDVRDMSTFNHLINLRKINSEIYRTFHSISNSSLLGPADLDVVRQDLYSQLNDWLITAPRYPMSSSMFQSPEWFQTAYHLAVIALNRPSFAQPQPSIESLQLCADSSISLISCYGSLYAKNKVSYSFVALSAIFMATVTMLYSLRASPQVRKDLTRQVIETNINSSLSLLRGISSGREVAERAARVIQVLGNAVLSLFDNEGYAAPDLNSNANDKRNVDKEFLSWFGLKSRMVKNAAVADVMPQQTQWTGQELSSDPTPDTPLATLSVDMAWEDLFAQGFGMENSAGIDFFPHSGF
ncbi:hypothetical protein LTS08_008336 [Lithohypha guttulata]|uniref:uncharacterized protein n=1 Tax=Lithohypha guttulata TaxID=1690604 RepID=UPI002DE17DBB|nr:hypothetical protein LTS08_008336 [Lithohypha guttulata]